MANKFEEKYSSKINPIQFPLPGFKFFHGASSEENVDDKYIEREKISERLKSWLTSKTTRTGVYLVTGFRGMGKSSFVGKVLNDITKKISRTTERIFKFLVLFISFIIAFLPPLCCTDINLNNKIKDLASFLTSFIKNNIILCLFILCLFIVLSIFIYIVDLSPKKRRLVIKLNLGHEILNERDILSLISNAIEYEYKTYISNWWANGKKVVIKYAVISVLTLILSLLFKNTLTDFYINNYLNANRDVAENVLIGNSFNSNNAIHTTVIGNSPNKQSVFFTVLESIKHAMPDYYKLVFAFCISTLFAFFTWLLWKLAGKLYTKIRPHNPTAIYNRLHDLNLRIVSATNEDVSPTGAYSPSFFGLTVNRRKNRSYPLADVREIEQRLSWILDEIVKSGKNAPEFIIVFDELDKIDPASNHNIDEKTDSIPAFENSGSGFTGGATTRKRKQNLLKLLANMKYFISTAKVKFVFIAGRELYDAYLADSSDREFAVGSIFNNVIYVNSFLWTTDPVQKDVTMMTEKFMCKLLLPDVNSESGQKIIKKLNLLPNAENNTKSSKEDDSRKIPEDYYTLKTYNKYLETRKMDERERIRRIMMLYQFTIYLAHTSNGAPKKISNYFEKYVVTEGRVEKKVINWHKQDFPKGKDIKRKKNADYLKFWLKSKTTETYFYLNFSYKDQRRIGFIHYLAFPVISAIFNNASRYDDKLLIAGCFLTNHIYKYHNSGFSWRNLENIPELLDINKSPETREFIEIIISFLKRSHISTTINSLYQFKFPMRIAEEISIMSRLSEEVSALFNFTLDEALSLKRHYSKLLEYYTALQNNTIQNTGGAFLVVPQNDLHHIIAGIHHILGDLHALDEEYNEAIFEYQYCISLLMKNYNDDNKDDDNEASNSRNNNDPHYLQHVLITMRVMLKLGLMFEKRKTHESAYATYNELIDLLIKFRYINPGELGLSYKQRLMKVSAWKDRNDILYKSDDWFCDSKFNNKVQPKIEEDQMNGLFKKLCYEINSKEMIPQLHQQLSPEKNTLATRLSVFEDISLVYQALLARLFLLGKEGLSGITKENIDIIESDFLYLQRGVYFREKYMIAADFFRKLADILYYKTGLMNEDCYNLYMSLYFRDYPIDKYLYEYCLENENDELLDQFLKLKLVIIDRNDKISNNDIIDIYEAEDDNVKNGKQYICTAGKINKNDRIIYISSVGKKDEEFLENLAGRIKVEVEGEPVPLFKFDKKAKTLTFLNGKAKRLLRCVDRRHKLLNGFDKSTESYTKNKRVPCYACKFYRRSLRIIQDNMIGKQTSNITRKKSKAVFFIEQLETRELLKSLRDSDILTLASSLDGLGNALFSCSHKGDNIGEQFMNAFVNLIKEVDKGKNYNVTGYLKNDDLSHLEKAILYFWAAAEYFKYAAKMKEAFFCHKKILHVFDAYLNVNKTNDDFDNRSIIGQHLGDIKTFFIRRIIRNLYAQYENTNMVEIHKLKWIFTKDIYDDIPLNLLSSFPDLEEIIILYCELELSCGIYKTIPQVYKSLFLSPYRTESTITERVVSLRFKADINMRILYKLLNCYNRSCNYLNTCEVNIRDNNIIYLDDFPRLFYRQYLSYIENLKELDWKTRLGASEYYELFYDILAEDNNTLKTKMELFEFLVIDTMFALSKIVETISPTTPTTLFSENYMGSVYKRLFECNQIFDFLYMMYQWCGLKDAGKDEEEKKNIENKIWNFSENRGKKFSDPEKNFVRKTLSKIKRITQVDKNYAKTFFDWRVKYIDKADIHNNQTNYPLEMALRKYKRAIEMHREGEAYQELIGNMYYLEDNLSNNTFQFNFAIERYFNNCGFLDVRKNRLKIDCVNASTLLSMDSYIEKEKKREEKNEGKNEANELYYVLNVF